MNVHEKFDDRLMEMFNSGNIDMDYINIELNPFIRSKVYEYQLYHIYNMILSVKNNDVSIDGSMTGTGKTYTSMATIKHLNYKPLIICPKNSVSMWRNVCKYFTVDPIAIVNYELIKNGGVYNNNYGKEKSKFLSVTDDGKYLWNFRDRSNTIVIFDEAHRCKNHKSGNGQLLMSLKDICKILLLSATICDNTHNFTIFGYMLGFYTSIKRGSKWIKTLIEEQEKTKNNNLIHKYIFPSKGSSMTVNDIPDKYPLNQITAECYDIDSKCAEQINNMYNDINSKKDSIKANNNGYQLISMIKERQMIENFKIPLIIELVDKYIEHQKSVVIFVNFINTQEKLMQHFDNLKIDYSYIRGDQNIKDKLNNIELFQNGVNRIMIATKSGSESISLHDTDGRYPRVSIISPSFSSIDFLQILGRIVRKGQKSPTLQIILYCANTVEEHISNVVKNKIKFIDRITDHDLQNHIKNQV